MITTYRMGIRLGEADNDENIKHLHLYDFLMYARLTSEHIKWTEEEDYHYQIIQPLFKF